MLAEIFSSCPIEVSVNIRFPLSNIPYHFVLPACVSVSCPHTRQRHFIFHLSSLIIGATAPFRLQIAHPHDKLYDICVGGYAAGADTQPLAPGRSFGTTFGSVWFFPFFRPRFRSIFAAAHVRSAKNRLSSTVMIK